MLTTVAFQPPDGQVVLTGSDDGTARLWQTAAGQAVGQPLRHPARVLSVAFSPDGRIMATGCGDGAARLWNAATGHPIGCPLLHHGPVRAVAFGPRPRESAVTTEGWILITGSEDMTARVWEVPSPAVESPEQLMRSLQAANGMIMDSHDVAESLAPGVWQQLRSEQPMSNDVGLVLPFCREHQAIRKRTAELIAEETVLHQLREAREPLSSRTGREAPVQPGRRVETRTPHRHVP